MKKSLQFTRLALLALTVLIAASSAMAYDFEVGGIYYRKG